MKSEVPVRKNYFEYKTIDPEFFMFFPLKTACALDIQKCHQFL